MKLFFFINASSRSGRTQTRLCFEKWFDKKCHPEEIHKWVTNLQGFASYQNYLTPIAPPISESFKEIGKGNLCGNGSYVIYRFADEPHEYIDIYGVWEETFSLIVDDDEDVCVTHEEPGRYDRVFTRLENVSWLNAGTLKNPKYVNIWKKQVSGWEKIN